MSLGQTAVRQRPERTERGAPHTRHTGNLWTFCSHIYANGRASQCRLICHSHRLSYGLLICPIVDMKRLTVGREEYDGGGARATQRALLWAAPDWWYNTNTRRGTHCLNWCVLLLFPFSPPRLCLYPSSSSSTVHAGWAPVGGVRGKTITPGSHKSTGRNSQAIYY